MKFLRTLFWTFIISSIVAGFLVLGLKMFWVLLVAAIILGFAFEMMDIGVAQRRERYGLNGLDRPESD